RVRHKLTGRYDCGPLERNEVAGGRFFEVSRTNSGCRVMVFEREYLSQSEWDKRYNSGTNALAQFLASGTTNPPVDAEAGRQQFIAMTDLLKLPQWSYEKISVDVDLQEPEVIYPGSDRDIAVAQIAYDEIISLLKPYDSTVKAGPGAAKPR